MDWGSVLDAAAMTVREVGLFAAAGFVILGAGDLLVDLIWFGLKLRERLAARSPVTAPTHDDAGTRDLAVFVPAWHEHEVIAPMLRHALERWGADGYRMYVGCYPNDPATIAAVRAVPDARIRLVVGTVNGPTTKADNLNRMWRAMLDDEAVFGTRFAGVVLVAGQ